MPIVADGQLNLAALQVDDLYVVIIPPQTPLIPGFPTDGIGLVGTGSRGEPNKAYPIGDVASAIQAFGDVANSPFDLLTEIIGALKQGANNIWGIRVTDGSDVAAFGHIVDNSAVPGANLVKFTALSSGIWGNGIVVNIGVGTNNVTIPASGTVTIGGTWIAADTVTATINGVACQYVTKAGDVPATIAVGLASKINSLVSAYVTASVAGAVITITAVTRGTAGNTLTLVATKASTSGTATASGATLAGATVGEQAYRVTVRTPNDPIEVFDNITGTGGTGAGSAALNIVNAITNGVQGLRGPSSMVTAAIATSPGSGRLINQAILLASGTDGRAGVTTTTLLGVDGMARTGMFALRGLKLAQFGLAGCTDPATWQDQIAYARSENLLAVLGVAQSSASTLSVANKNANSVDAWEAVMAQDFLYLNDTKNGQIRLVSPIGAVLGKIATLSPERSPGNKPIFGYLGTERTGFVGPGGTFRAPTPYSYAEIALLEGSGITFISSPSVGGNFLSMRHGQNCSSDPTRNGINYTKLTQFIAKSIHASMGFAVNEVHTPDLRRRVKSALLGFCQILAEPGPGRNPMIETFFVQCDDQNNKKPQVDQGYLFAFVQIKYFAIVRFFVVQIEAGQSVTVKVVPNNPINAAAA